MRTFDPSRLETLRTLGEGANGPVAAVRDLDGGTLLARKRVDAADRRETELLSRLRHPDLLALEGTGGDADGRFLLTELCEAGDLSRVLADDPSAAPALLADALRGLAFLHARGLVHGDVKPQNLLVGADRRLRIADLGLARAQEAAERGGTPGFMAPERLAARSCTALSDLWSLGAAFAAALGAPFPPDPLRASEAWSQALASGDVARRAGPIAPLLVDLLRYDPSDRPPGARAAARRLAAATGDPALARETADSARAYLRPFRLAGRADALDGLCKAAAQPGIVLLRAAPGSGGTRVLEELAVALDGDLVDARFAAALPVSDRPLMVDNADAADDRLAAALAQWQRRAVEGEETRAAVVLVRPGGPRDRALAAEGARAADLPALDEHALEALVSEAFPDRGDPRPLARRLHALCGGAPARAVTALSALHARGLSTPGVLVDEDVPGPEALDALGPLEALQSIDAELPSLLPPDSTERRVAALAACARRPLTASSARVAFEAGAAGASFAAFSGATRLLRDRGVLAAGDDLAPDGAHVRASLVRILGDDERRAAHRALLRAVENRQRPWDDETDPLDLADRAHHLLALGDPRSTAAVSQAAAALLAKSLAREAVSLLDSASSSGTLAAADRLVHARALARVGETDRALELARGAAAEGTPGAALLGAELLVRRGDYRTAVAELEACARDEAGDALLARALSLSGQHDRALEACDAALGRAVQAVHRADLAATAALAAYYKGDPDAAEQRYRTARDLAREAADRPREAAAVNGLGLVAQRRARFDEARARYEDALALAQSCDDRAREGTCHLNLGTVLQELGRTREAAQAYRRAGTVARLVGERVQSARARSNLANLLIFLGSPAEARPAAEAARDLAASAGAGVVRAWSILLLGEAAMHEGRRDEAQERFQEARGLFASLDSAAEALEAGIFLARLDADQGDRSRSVAAALEVAASARARGLDQHEARALLVAADALCDLGGRGAEALAAAHRALGLALPSKRPDLLWRVEAALARASAPDAPAQAHHSARALAGLDAAAKGVDPEDRAGFLSRADRVRLKGLVAPYASLRAEAGDPRLARLLAVNRRLGAERNLKALLDEIVDQAVELCGAERGFVLLAPGHEGTKEEKQEPLHVVVARNIDGESLAKGALRVSRSIAERVMGEGEPELTLDAQEDERYAQQLSIAALKLRSVLCVPLRFQSKVLGALYLDNRFRAHAFGPEDLRLLESFADQAAIALAQVKALDEARLAREAADRARAEIEELNRRLSDRVRVQEAEIERARREADEQRLAVATSFGELVGESPAMRRVLRLLERIASTELTVLVTGESGTGKELVARALFAHGPRRDRPFVSINCAALAEGLLESELFGHVRGAFTGADRDKDGLFQVAHGGTLFLDEVGDMGPSMQAKLLRALQEGEIRRVGGRSSTKVDVRVVAATNRELEKLMKEGKFREDLYYRLNVVSVHLPPLRERREDLPLLCARLLADLPGRPEGSWRLSADALALLGAYSWPGNVRELRATLHTAALFAEGDVLGPGDFSNKTELFRRSEPAAGASPAGRTMEQIELDAIRQTLQETHGNKTETARRLGIDRKTLYNKLARLGEG